MPLTELMNYFNDQLQHQARTKSLQQTGFFKANNSYWGRFGNLIIGSRFHQITSAKDDIIIGYTSESYVRSATGNLLNIDSIFNSLDSHDQIIHLDRLIRTLHSLNYLQQYENSGHLLALQVQPRHIVSVESEHGKTFEKILSDCGLGPEKVILHTRFLDTATLPHFYKALHNYRIRGYKIGIDLDQIPDLDLLIASQISPDFILAGNHNIAGNFFEREYQRQDKSKATPVIWVSQTEGVASRLVKSAHDLDVNIETPGKISIG